MHLDVNVNLYLWIQFYFYFSILFIFSIYLTPFNFILILLEALILWEGSTLSALLGLGWDHYRGVWVVQVKVPAHHHGALSSWCIRLGRAFQRTQLAVFAGGKPNGEVLLCRCTDDLHKRLGRLFRGGGGGGG